MGEHYKRWSENRARAEAAIGGSTIDKAAYREWRKFEDQRSEPRLNVTYTTMGVGANVQPSTNPKITATESFRFRKFSTRLSLKERALQEWHLFPSRVGTCVDKAGQVLGELKVRKARAALTIGIGFLAGLGGVHEVLDPLLATAVGTMWAEPYWPRGHAVEQVEEKKVAFPQIRHWGLNFTPTPDQEAAYWKCTGARCCNIQGIRGAGKTMLSVALAIEHSLETGKTSLVWARHASELPNWYRLACDIVQPKQRRAQYQGRGMAGEELILPNGAMVLLAWGQPESLRERDIGLLVMDPQHFLNLGGGLRQDRLGPDLILDFRLEDRRDRPIGWAGVDTTTVWLESNHFLGRDHRVDALAYAMSSLVPYVKKEEVTRALIQEWTGHASQALDKVVTNVLLGKRERDSPPPQAAASPPTQDPLPAPARSRSWRARLHAAWRHFVPSRASRTRPPA